MAQNVTQLRNNMGLYFAIYHRCNRCNIGRIALNVFTPSNYQCWTIDTIENHIALQSKCFSKPMCLQLLKMVANDGSLGCLYLLDQFDLLLYG